MPESAMSAHEFYEANRLSRDFDIDTFAGALIFAEDYAAHCLLESEHPDIEEVAAQVHRAWIEAKLSQGITSRKSEDGEEQIVPYEKLSEGVKELDRIAVRTVLAALARLREVKG